MKKKVLQFIGSFHQGGSERQAVQLTKLLLDDGEFEVFLATLNRQGVLLDEVEKLKLPDIPEFKLTSFFNLDFLKKLQLCAKFIIQNNIEIVHTHDFYTNVFGILAGRLAGVKVKISSKRETAGMRTASQNLIEKFIFRISDLITVNSQSVKNYLLAEGVSVKKIRVIYNGLDLHRLQPQETNKTLIKQELGLPIEEDVKFVTLVANLRHEVKNQAMLLKAAEKVVRVLPQVQFIFAGEGELQASLESLAEELKVSKNVRFIGRCRKVPELLSISDIGVLTSFAEGFSNSILEYMAVGLPVVATDVGGAGEAIIHGKTGFLVKSDDYQDLAERLLELLKDSSKAVKFGEAGKNSVKENFSLEIQLENIKKLYQ